MAINNSNDLTLSNLAAFAAAGDLAFQSKVDELNSLASDQPPPRHDAILTNKLLTAWTALYGDRNSWPKGLADAYETIVANIGLGSFENSLTSAMQSIRIEPETLPAFQAAVDVVQKLSPSPLVPVRWSFGGGEGWGEGESLIPDSAAAAGLSFVRDPANIILPLYGGALAGRLVGALVARFGASLGLAAEAMAGVGTASSLVAESTGFVVTGNGIQYVAEGFSPPSDLWNPKGFRYTLQEIGAATLFFGMLRALGSGTNLIASLLATGETGLATARLIGHTGAITSLAATEELQEMAGIGQPACSGEACLPAGRHGFAESGRASSATTFYERMWRSLFLYTTLSATRGVLNGVTGQPNAAHQISAEALELIGSMRQALAQPEPAGVIARSVSDEAISRDHSISGDRHVGLQPPRDDNSSSGLGIPRTAAMRSTGSVGSTKAVAAPPPPPPPPPVNKQWGIYVLQVPGHGLDADYAKMNNQLAVKGTSNEAHIVLRGVGEDGRLNNQWAQTVDLENNGLFDQYASGPASSQHLEKHILNRDAMATFLTEAAETFPADRVCVSFEGHSGELRQFIPEIHAGLQALTERLGRKIDIILFDSCFMAQIEIATQFSDVARFLVASQEGVVKFRSFPLISRWLARDGSTTPEQLAKDIAHNNKEFTFSAIDLEKVAALNQAMKALGEVILTINDNKAFKAIRKAVRDATGYYTEGLFSHNHFSNTVDLKGYIRGIAKNRYLRKNFREVTKAAAMVLEVFGEEGEGVIIKERHASKTDQYYLDYTDVRGSNGLSIHQRTTPKWLWNAYTHLKESVFERVTGWNKVTDHITQGNPTYIVASVLSFAGGAATAGVNNGLQRVVEIWTTYWFNRKMKMK